MKESLRKDGDRIARFQRIAYLVLWIEAVSIVFWPAFALIGAFLVAALIGLPAALSTLPHILFLTIFTVLLIWLGWRGKQRLTPPAPSAALRRVENDSELRHRPFETLSDRSAGNEEDIAASLWKLHLDRKRNDIKHLRLSLPHPALSEHDPNAVRLLVLITLIAGFIIAGPRAGRLIAASLLPNLTSADTTPPLEAWIKPPSYTGLATILLKPGFKNQIAVPIGSVIEAHVTGGSRAPRFTLGKQREDFRQLDGGGFALSQKLSTAGQLNISRGWSTLGEWNIGIIPDSPPTVEFTDTPSGAESGALKVEYHATDDYGVASVDMRVRLDGDEQNIVADPIATTLSSDQTEKEVAGTSYQDLTSHPWAGMKVSAKLIATDSAGQTKESDEVPFVLPERIFTNPAAQAIIIARKHIILNDAKRFQIIGQISRIASQPELYGDKYSVFLALRAAGTQIGKIIPQDRQGILDIEDLLWNAALKIDGGDRLEAEQALRAAEDALEKALKDPKTPPPEIAQLTKNLKEALNKQLDAMAENMRQRMARGEEQDKPFADPNTQILSRNDLENQIDQMDQMAQDGSREDAEKMLSSLKDMLENMRSGQNQNNDNPQAKKALEELKDIAKKQRALEKNDADKAARKEPAPEKNTDPKAQDKAEQKQATPEKNGAPNAAQEQEALRKSLGDTARDVGESMGNIPKSLSAADKAMRDAASALQNGKKGDAQAQQENAASQLEQAVQNLGAQLSQDGGTPISGNGPSSHDPLGRGGSTTPSGVKVPTKGEIQRSRAILDELRRRSSEHTRPRPELDYLQRLLQ